MVKKMTIQMIFCMMELHSVTKKCKVVIEKSI